MKKLLLCLLLINCFAFSIRANLITTPENPENNTIGGTNTTKVNNSLELKQNYPNPFNGKTSIIIQSSITQKVEFKIFDMLGNLIVQKFLDLDKGQNMVEFEREKLSQGLYFYSVDNGNQNFTKRMTIKD